MSYFDEEALKNVWIGFLSGGASSAVVGYFIYRQQKIDAEIDSRDFVLMVYQILKDGRENRDILNTVKARIDELPPQKRLGFISGEFSVQDAALRNPGKKKEEYVEVAMNYKALADAYAQISASTERFDILNNLGHLSVDRLVAAHAKMFPPGYLWAGRLRTETVLIGRTFKARGRSMDASLSSIQVGVTPPEQINTELNRLLSEWNATISNTIRQDEIGRCEELAHFHQQFLLIHPFLDGNGRLARAILREQSKLLFSIDRPFDFERASYYFYSGRFLDYVFAAAR